jgi:Fe(3+) dicitrate transport protein
MRFHRGQLEVSHTALVGDDLQIDTTAYLHKFTRDWFKVDGMTGANLSEVLQSPDSARNEPYYRILTGQENSVGQDELLRLRDNYRYYSVVGLQSRLGLSVATGSVLHEIEAGARIHYDEVNRRHTDQFFAMAGATQDELGHLEAAGVPDELVTDSLGQTVALSLHAIDEITIKKLTLSPGLRAEIVYNRYTDHLNPTGDNKRWQVGILPGIGAHYALSEELGVFSGIYRGFSPVSPQPGNSGGPEPQAESSIVTELGARLRQTEFQLELVGFLNAYQNLTAICSESRGCDTTNVGTQYDGGAVNVYGLEALAGYLFRAGPLVFPLRLSYALTTSRFLTSFDSQNPEWGDVREGDELPYLPTHQGTIQAGVGRETRWSLDSQVSLVSESREIAGQGVVDPGEQTDGAVLLGLSGRLRIIDHLWGSLRVTNLFDTGALSSRRPYGARPVAPRTILAGLELTY